VRGARGGRVSDELVTGRRAVVEAIRAGQVREVLVAAGARDTQGLRAVREAARAAKVPVRAADRRALDAMAGDHRGVVARTVGGRAGTRQLGERDLATLAFAPDALVVVLDGITDPQNLGAAARTAEAAGAAALVTRSRRAAGVTPAAIRASAGALEHLPHAVVANIARALSRLQEAGFSVIGLDGGASSSIFDEECPAGRVAVVVGSEGEGMSRLVRERCDLLVALPVKGRVGSLNASAALAAAVYGFVLRRDVVASPPSPG
jgi:23S rRNA (guanosine2251-2'-O)-methyltransferase